MLLLDPAHALRERLFRGPRALRRAAQLDLVQRAFPPRRPRLPSAGAAWATAFKPLMLALVGATFAGQAVAFFMQLRNGEKDCED